MRYPQRNGPSKFISDGGEACSVLNRHAYTAKSKTRKHNLIAVHGISALERQQAVFECVRDGWPGAVEKFKVQSKSSKCSRK
eukprot:711855-Rhodomonas_salina.1